jgi:hypothetical protein
VDQGFELYTTGRLTVRVADPEAIHDFGRMVEADPHVATAFMARAEERFGRATSVLPDAPDAEAAEAWLVALRKGNWDTEGAA